MKSLALLTLFFVSGCATEGNYQEAVSSWIGKSESALVSSWGPPDSTYNMKDAKILTYRSSAGSNSRLVYGRIVTQDMGCKTNFTVNNIGLVERWAYEGNACRAY
jgi:hypothetical protein